MQPCGQCGTTVVAQTLCVGDRDEKQVQRCAATVTLVNDVALYQGLVNPTELLWNFAQPLRAQQRFGDLHDGSC